MAALGAPHLKNTVVAFSRMVSRIWDKPYTVSCRGGGQHKAASAGRRHGVRGPHKCCKTKTKAKQTQEQKGMIARCG